MNYLMLDDYIEPLSLLQTGVSFGFRKIWNISKSD